MTPALLLVIGLLVVAVFAFRRRWLDKVAELNGALRDVALWRKLAGIRLTELSAWRVRAYDLGYTPELTEVQARRVLRDLFSAERDVERLRDWREQRALRSSDHTTLHHFPADSDREAVGHLLRASGRKVQ